MYEPNTILELKEPKPDEEIPARKDPDTGRTRPKQKVPFPYNRVRVIGRSPVDHTGGRGGGNWEGVGATGVLIEPLSGHGSNLDEPLGKLQKIYKIVEVPPAEVIAEPIRVIRPTSQSAGPTPEEQFAAEAERLGIEQPKPGNRRPKAKSPLGDIEPEETKGPLD